MGVYTPAAKIAMLDHLRSLITHASLHTGDPGTSGANEASGGSPAYARVPVSFGAATTPGEMSHGSLTWNLPAGTFTHVGYWSALTGGQFYASDDLATAQVLSSSGQLTIVSALADLAAA